MNIERPPSEVRVFEWLTLPMLKTFGYLVSTASVILLAIVSWPKAKEDPLLMGCLFAGVATSIIGMSCRWLTYQIENCAKRGA